MHDNYMQRFQPDPSDRAHFPLDSDLKNHIYMAKHALQLSCLDQENGMLKIEQWKKEDPESTHFFRPFVAHENPIQPEVQKNGEGDGETENAVLSILRASSMLCADSLCIMNSATNEYPTFVLTQMKNRANSYFVVLYVASISVIVLP